MKILPCPFCSRQPKYISRPSDVSETKEFHILSCFCGTYSSRAWQGADSEAAVITLWNTRSAP